MRGTTLLELMIAMLLAALTAAGALATMAHVHRSWRAAEQTGRLHERALYVFGTLEPELQLAGYYGSAQTPELVAAARAPDTCGNNTVTSLRPAVRVLRGNWSLPCAAQGSGHQAGSDVVILHRASTRTANTAGALLLRDKDTGAQHELVVRIFYVAQAADGDVLTPALRVKSLTAIAGRPAFIDTEVMPGVTTMQVDLLPDAIHPRQVHVHLVVRTDAADVAAGEQAPTLTMDRTFALRNHEEDS